MTMIERGFTPRFPQPGLLPPPDLARQLAKPLLQPVLLLGAAAGREVRLAPLAGLPEVHFISEDHRTRLSNLLVYPLAPTRCIARSDLETLGIYDDVCRLLNETGMSGL